MDATKKSEVQKWVNQTNVMDNDDITSKLKLRLYFIIFFFLLFIIQLQNTIKKYKYMIINLS